VTPPPSRSLRIHLIYGLLIAGLLLSTRARAGVRADFEPPAVESWSRLGFLTYKPAFGLRNIGQDSNVFYDPDSGDPKSDFTATASPVLDGLITLGNRGFVTMHAKADYVWYETYSNVNHLDTGFSVRGNLNLRKLRLFLRTGYERAFERPSNETDQRAERISRPQRGGVGYELSPVTALDVIYARESIEYTDKDYVATTSCPSHDPGDPPVSGCHQYFLGDQLSRTESSTTLRVTHRVFGRTRLVLDAAEIHHDFQSDVPPPNANGDIPAVGSFHDARESRVLAGFEVDRGGFLSGLVRFGITDFEPKVATDLATRTSVGAATLNWRLGGRASLTTGYDRDLYFSIYGNNLYFIQSHGEVECLFYLNRVLALDGGYEQYWLDYPRTGPGEPRKDDIRVIKGGLRFRVANRTVWTVSVSDRVRTSTVPQNGNHQVLVTTGVETNF
jgi:hypothetical protein